MIIIKSGYLKMNHQSLVAVIVFGNGGQTQTLVTKRQALEIGEAHVGVSITDEEWLAIKEQIHASPLVDRNKSLEEACNEFQNDLEELKRRIELFIKHQKKLDGEGEDWKLG